MSCTLRFFNQFSCLLLASAAVNCNPATEKRARERESVKERERESEREVSEDQQLSAGDLHEAEKGLQSDFRGLNIHQSTVKGSVSKWR